MVDLAFCFGIPSFEVVLSRSLEELVVEGAIAAEEAKEQNPAVYGVLGSLLPEVDFVPHEDLKHMTAATRLVVRMGEATPYAKVVLRCGVPF